MSTPISTPDSHGDGQADVITPPAPVPVQPQSPVLALLSLLWTIAHRPESARVVAQALADFRQIVAVIHGGTEAGPTLPA